MRMRLLLCAVFALVVAAACTAKVDESYKAALATFYEDVKLVDDPLFKQAALKEDEEPQRAKDYFDAHERLRNAFDDPKAKAAVLAAFLALEPTSLRPIKATATPDGAEVVVALGPTDDRTAVFALKKVDTGWKILDFNGVWKKRQAELGTPIPEPGESGTPTSAAN
ncbi:MAG: hypothetical protein KJ042_03265 [Deltaproteobacteria bacterium]|nr:hypothetical protein [Deltaproteobacteria bacterium]